ncbi:DUF1800 domain-containing protein [Flavobacterium amniphilum]|uniref:DUF1800 domain-containing protein n=1 Tax=Flavobacterium amniphilum TaxID=1834035 RepID=UPI00202A3D65|nr:DUF1800 domain-containing protein [Flavobacterium amniphilum]MCL9806216.1 DUF1800 domain-containing protein [Flavobacterium amniphilum]
MNKSSLWSLRLGFSNEQSAAIENMGLEKFLAQSFSTPVDNSIPSFLEESPKSIKELKGMRKNLKESDPEAAKKLLNQEIKVSVTMKSWWLEKMSGEQFPLREKMTCFWHNHYVSTFQKVKVNHWVFQHNQLLRKNAFGNFRELTKEVIKTNAMVRYLDNVDNRSNKINENLSRELLELFTLGIGNYTEADIQNGAKALAGLGIGEDNAMYRPVFENNETITYLGQNGKFKADDLVDIIFKQKNVPYFLTRKILQWFIYDNPPKELVTYYGDYFRQVDFEIKPLLTKIFTEEYAKDNAGSKIKNPLEYSLHLIAELNIKLPNYQVLSFFLKEQGMDLFNQPNVKGWEGGKAWLTSQIYLQRNNVSDLFCNGKTINRRILKGDAEANNAMVQNIPIQLDWKGKTNKEIIKNLTDRLLFEVDDNTQKDFETILKYDFNPDEANANQAVLRLFNAITKTPEFQLI